MSERTLAPLERPITDPASIELATTAEQVAMAREAEVASLAASTESGISVLWAAATRNTSVPERRTTEVPEDTRTVHMDDSEMAVKVPEQAIPAETEMPIVDVPNPIPVPPPTEILTPVMPHEYGGPKAASGEGLHFVDAAPGEGLDGVTEKKVQTFTPVEVPIENEPVGTDNETGVIEADLLEPASRSESNEGHMRPALTPHRELILPLALHESSSAKRKLQYATTVVKKLHKTITDVADDLETTSSELDYRYHNRLSPRLKKKSDIPERVADMNERLTAMKPINDGVKQVLEVLPKAYLINWSIDRLDAENIEEQYFAEYFLTVLDNDTYTDFQKIAMANRLAIGMRYAPKDYIDKTKKEAKPLIGSFTSFKRKLEEESAQGSEDV